MGRIVEAWFKRPSVTLRTFFVVGWLGASIDSISFLHFVYFSSCRCIRRVRVLSTHPRRHFSSDKSASDSSLSMLGRGSLGNGSFGLIGLPTVSIAKSLHFVVAIRFLVRVCQRCKHRLCKRLPSLLFRVGCLLVTVCLSRTGSHPLKF
jgi:hypothetical protein